jgi:uncharacterized cupredoxin-like copper-binding protein
MRWSLIAALTLILVGAAGPGALAQNAPQTVTVTLTSYDFAPGTIALKAGEPVTLHLVNSAGKDHNFSAPEFFAAASLAPADRAKVEDGAVEVEQGQSVDLTLTPAKPGSYKLECTHFLHATFGMTGRITVE